MGMHLHTNTFSIFFGNSCEKIEARLSDDNNNLSPSAIITLEAIMNILKARSLSFARQEHGTSIADLSGASPLPLLLDSKADILATSKTGIAVGVITADCLPLVCYDPQNHATIIVHAGWKGTLQHAAKKAIQFMQTHYKSNPKNILCFLGPAAQPCCYEVSPSFEKTIDSYNYAHSYKAYLSSREAKHYFDVSACNKAQLLAAGITESNIDTSSNLCTICNPEFCSHRRAPGWRQVSIALLN